MTEKKIKDSLATAIEESTPDILDSLMSELNITDEPKELMQDILAADADTGARWMPRRAKTRTNWRKAVMGCAAALVLVVAGLSIFNSNREAFALVSLDVNPGIEISIDNKERVLAATPVNEEGREILSDMKLKGSDINVACNAIVGSMLTHGYLTDLSNSILVSVVAEDEAAGNDLESKLSRELNEYLENSEVVAAILGQSLGNDENIRKFADENGISIGKAWLIKNLLETGSSKMTESDLLKLSTQELILLGQKRSVAGAVTSYGNAESGKYIGSEKAVVIALEKAGVDKSAATNLKYEFDCEDGVLIYEVSFYAGNYEYDYDINAIDGSVVSYEKEYEDPSISSNSSGSGNNSGSSSGGSSGGSKSSGNNSNSKKSSGSSKTIKSGDDTYKVEGGTVYEYDDDDDKWEPETDKKIENGKVYEKDDGKWKADDDDHDDDDDDKDDDDDHDDDDDDDDD